MRPLIQKLIEKARDERATTLVIGAGNGAELPQLRQLGGSRLVLVEAHPALAQTLVQCVDVARGEEVWPLAITAAPAEQATLHVVNNPQYSSLKPPADLDVYFRNLRVVQQMKVPARSLADAIESLALDTDAGHLLVLDVPGQAHELLSATPPRALQSFARIIVRSTVEPLYVEDRSLDDVLALLRDIGFDVDGHDPEAIYPHAAALLGRNDARVDRQRFETLLGQVSAECETQTRLASERSQEIGLLTQERDAQARLAAEHKAELEKAEQTIAGQHKLVSAGEAQIQKLAQDVNAQRKLVEQHKADLVGISKQNHDRGIRIAQLENEQAEMGKRQARFDREMIKAEAQIDLIKDVLLREQDL